MRLCGKFSFEFLAVWFLVVLAGCWLSGDPAFGATNLGTCGSCANCVQFDQVATNVSTWIGYVVPGTNGSFVLQAFGGTECGNTEKGYSTASCKEVGCASDTNDKIGDLIFGNGEACTNSNNYDISQAANLVTPMNQELVVKTDCTGGY